MQRDHVRRISIVIGDGFSPTDLVAMPICIDETPRTPS
jgi:hypothetical protein